MADEWKRPSIAQNLGKEAGRLREGYGNRTELIWEGMRKREESSSTENLPSAQTRARPVCNPECVWGRLSAPSYP